MKFATLAVISGVAGVAYAQSGLGGVPTCAQPCLTPYISGTSIAGCNSLDITCICSNSGFITGIESCVCQKCSASDQAATIKYALGLCAANQVTNLPSSLTCAATASSTAGGSSATSGASSAGTTAAPATTTSAATTTAGASVASTSSHAAAPTMLNGVGAGVLGVLGAAAVLL